MEFYGVGILTGVLCSTWMVAEVKYWEDVQHAANLATAHVHKWAMKERATLIATLKESKKEIATLRLPADKVKERSVVAEGHFQDACTKNIRQEAIKEHLEV